MRENHKDKDLSRNDMNYFLHVYLFIGKLNQVSNQVKQRLKRNYKSMLHISKKNVNVETMRKIVR